MLAKKNAQHEHNYAAKPTYVQTREATGSRVVSAFPAVSVGSGCWSLGLWSRAKEKVGRTTRTVGVTTKHALKPGTAAVLLRVVCAEILCMKVQINVAS